ncbi:hypothetical protein SCLCIDRAFT_128274, partial [Scleroderma citrinum Foug A]
GSAEEQKLECEAGNPNAKDWHDEAMKIVEETMTEYWEQMKPSTTSKPPANSPNEHSKRPLESDFDRLRQEHLLQATVRTDNGGWKPELWRYLTDIPKDISKEMDIVAWWAAHSDDYPTLLRIAMDICAIPATSVPCEQLFSAGAEIATNRHSCLGANRFEQLQILKHAW